MEFIASTHTFYNTKRGSWIYNFSREIRFQFKSIFKLKLKFGFS